MVFPVGMVTPTVCRRMRKPPWYGNSQWHGISGAYAGQDWPMNLQGWLVGSFWGMPADWPSYAGGVQRLMEHLRGSLGLPQLPEMTDHLTKHFKQGRRKRGESMGDRPWIEFWRHTGAQLHHCRGLLHPSPGLLGAELGPMISLPGRIRLLVKR